MTTIDGLAGWWTERHDGDRRRSAESLQFRFRAGGFDMKVIELEPARASALGGGRRARPSGSARRSSWDLRQDGDYTIVLFKHEGWKEPVEFMHHCSTKWATYLMSLKSLVETGHGRTGAARRQDQQLALTLAATGDTRKPQRLTHGCRITDPGSSPVGRPRRRSLGYPGGASAWRALSSGARRG